MAKRITRQIKLQLPAGKATAAPPVGTVLGPAGVNIGTFVNEFNSATRDKMGEIIPVLMSVYEDRSFTFIMKQPPASRLILSATGIEKGSGKTPAEKAGKLSKAKLEEVAKRKMEDMNAPDLASAMKTLTGTARSMGIDIV